MAAKTNLKAVFKTNPEQEKLWYFVTLRQFEAQSDTIRDAYKRLAAVALEANGWDTETVILDWLEDELRALRKRGNDRGPAASQLMAAAVTLANALKQ